LYELNQLGVPMYDDKCKKDDLRFAQFPVLRWSNVKIMGSAHTSIGTFASTPEEFLKTFCRAWPQRKTPTTVTVSSRLINIYKTGIKVCGDDIWIPKDDVITIYKVLSIESTNY